MPAISTIKDSELQIWVDRLGFNKIESLNSASAVIVLDYIPQKDLARVIYGNEIREEFPNVSLKPARDSYGRIFIYAEDRKDSGDAAEALHMLNRQLFRAG